ncbi:hypothetical protein NUACC21_04360 [Scytonema sp. NUACC21]
MISNKHTLLDRNKNLDYIGEHKRAFQVESIYPLEIFERFVREATDWGLECSCKIEKDKVYPIRFNLFRNHPGCQQFNAALDFFRQVETRNDVKLDYQLMHLFLGNDFDLNKIAQILVGVDLRTELLASRLKLWFVIEDYPEKLETAFALCDLTEELRSLMLSTSLVVVGFDFYLDGRSIIELYPRILKKELQQVDVWKPLTKVLSPATLQLLDSSWAFMLGFSKANPETIVYCPTSDPDSFLAKLPNNLAQKVHAYYQKQPVRGTIIAFRERELLGGAIQNLNLYYQMSLGVPG